MKRGPASVSGLLTGLAFPLVEQTLDMSQLCIVERHSLHDAASLPRIVVCNCCLEMLTLGRRDTQLAPQPSEKRHRCGGSGHARLTVPSLTRPHRLVA